MIPGIVQEFFDAIKQHVSDAFSGLSEFIYLAEWYLLGIAVLILALVIGYFFNFSWMRSLLGFIVLAYGAFLAGLQVMANHAKKDNEAYRQKIKELQAEQKEKNTNHSWFS